MTTLNASRFDSLRGDSLQWLPERGLGWYPVKEAPYDAQYWQRYRAMDQTTTGHKLTKARVGWVRLFTDEAVCDVGIGGGRFVKEARARGFDVNPEAVAWLKQQEAWCDPYEERVPVATFWDSLEHIHDPAPILENVTGWVFTSIPIFSGPEHVLRSKHYRKDEHCWYFTVDGLIRFMADAGFELAGWCAMEQAAGREDIETFAFRRLR